jgi:hypothetical protein
LSLTAERDRSIGGQWLDLIQCSASFQAGAPSLRPPRADRTRALPTEVLGLIDNDNRQA